MNRFSRFFATALLAAASTVALAEESAGQSAAPPADDQDIRCTNEYRTGSNLPRRVCTTREQREQQRAAAQEMMQDLNRAGGQRTPGGN